MKKLKLAFAATVLTLALSLSAFAGDMQCGVTSQAPAPPASMTAGDMETGLTSQPSQPSVTGQMETGIASTDPLTQIALVLLSLVTRL